jgi:cell division protein FtsB
MNRSSKWGQALTIGVIAYLLISGNRGLWHLYQLHQEKKFLSVEINQLKSEISRNQAEYQSLGKNATSLEKQAREELNLIKPGEMVYKFAPSSGVR